MAYKLTDETVIDVITNGHKFYLLESGDYREIDQVAAKTQVKSAPPGTIMEVAADCECTRVLRKTKHGWFHVFFDPCETHEEDFKNQNIIPPADKG